MDSGATLKSIVINKIDEPIAAYWDYPNQLKLNFMQHLDIKQPTKYTKATLYTSYGIDYYLAVNKRNYSKAIIGLNYSLSEDFYITYTLNKNTERLPIKSFIISMAALLNYPILADSKIEFEIPLFNNIDKFETTIYTSKENEISYIFLDIKKLKRRNKKEKDNKENKEKYGN